MDGVRRQVVGGCYGRVAGVVDGTYQRAKREHVASRRRIRCRLQLNFRRHIVEVRLCNTRLLYRPRQRREF